MHAVSRQIGAVNLGIVEFDREVVAALAGVLRLGSADLGTADVNPVARALSLAWLVSGTMRTLLA
jgi:hypothetical protein